MKQIFPLLSPGKMYPTVIDKSSPIEAIESGSVIKNAYFCFGVPRTVQFS